MSLDEVYQLLPSVIHPIYFLYYFIFVLFHFCAEPTRWSLYLNNCWKRHFSLFFNIFSFTAFVSYILPLKMGLPTRVILLKTKANLSLADITGLLAIDGLVYYAMWGICAGLSFMFILSPDSILNYQFNRKILWAIPVIITILFFLHLFLKSRRTAGRGKDGKLFPDKGYFADLRAWIKEKGARTFSLKPGILSTVAAVIGMDIGGQILRHWSLCNILGYHLSLQTLAIITCLAVFTGLMSMMPMGLGGYDATVILLLTQAGLPFEASAYIPILNRLGTILTAVLLGLWGGWKLGLNPLKLGRM